MRTSRSWRFGVLAAAALLAAPLVLQAQGSLRQGLAAKSIFPLQPGDSWTYARRGPAGVSEWTVQATERVAPPRALPYVSLVGYFPGPAHAVRSDLFGTVTERSNGLRDHLWYLLGSPAGTSWTLQLAPSPAASPLPDCVSGSRLTLAARGETLSVPAGDFSGVVKVDWMSSCADAGLSSEWFAPGVGLIRRDEVTIAGTVTSELVRATLGGNPLPQAGYTTSIALDRSIYVYNLMPPVGPGAIPTVAGRFTVRGRPDQPTTLAFYGCKSVAIEVRDENGDVVAEAKGDDGACCTCRTYVEWDIGHAPLVVPFAFKLAGNDGHPLPDGRYAVSAVLESRDAEPLRPAARALIEVASTH